MQTLTLKSYAKLNLYLKVLKLRKDNYHNLSTVFERISLFDTITLTSRKDNSIRIISAQSSIPKDRTNLAYKSAKLLQDAFGIAQGLDIRITKRIPVGAGMGGGSSNAASVLLGLNRLWRLGLTQAQLIALARKLGSDVPFFVCNTSFAHGRGRGDKITPLTNPAFKRLWHVLAVPRINVPTPFVYKNWDELKLLKNTSVRLTIPRFDVTLLLLALKKHDVALLSNAVYNSLEQVTFVLHPELMNIKKALVQQPGISSVLMSGSGPTVFGIASSRARALAAEKKLKAAKKGWRIFVARTI